MSLVVRHKLDEELVSRGDNWRGGDLPTVLPHQLTVLIHTISYLHIVISEQEKRKRDSISYTVLYRTGSFCSHSSHYNYCYVIHAVHVWW